MTGTLAGLGFGIPRLSFDEQLGKFLDSRILITGAGGFLGRHLDRLLSQLGAGQVIAITGYGGSPGYDGRELSGYDLSRTEEAYYALMGDFDYVFHLAGYNGGIKFNLDNPFDIFATNTQMAANVLDAARRNKVKKVVSVVASCAYPEMQLSGNHLQGWMYHNREVMEERGLHDGPPHHTVACHGYAKRNLQLLSSYAKRQYGLNAVCVCPTTLYGPGDSFDPARTKVMGGMVKRFVDAVDDGADAVTVWGTGRPYREFLYAPDCARLLIESMLGYDDSDVPLNLGTGQELSIKSLAETVAAAVEFRGAIHFDDSKPDGQFRKRLDLTRMHEVVGQFSPTPLVDGIKATAADYRARKQEGRL